LGSLRDRKTKVLVTGISLHRGPVGERGTSLVYQGLSETDDGGLWKRGVCL
jgi:hypothetical protein